MLAASASYFLVYMLVVAESNVGIFPAERPSPAGAVNVVQMVDTPIATMSAEAAKQKVRTEQAQKSQTEQEQREKTERARKKQSNQAQVEAAAAAKAAAAAAAAAATAERRQILAAEKAERERRENAERERRKEIDERERKDKAEREERLQEQLVEAALAEAEKDEANKAREVRKRAEQVCLTVRCGAHLLLMLLLLRSLSGRRLFFRNVVGKHTQATTERQEKKPILMVYVLAIVIDIAGNFSVMISSVKRDYPFRYIIGREIHV